MNFAVNVTDKGLDSLPQDLPFNVLGALIDELETKLGVDPIGHSRRVDHPLDAKAANACYGGFRIEGRNYVFTAFFYYSIDEQVINVWRIRLTEE
jgi:hypothetical protein